MLYSPDIEEKLKFIEKVFGSFDVESKDNIQVRCPQCIEEAKSLGLTLKKKKLAILLNPFIFHCWVCGYKGALIKCLYDYFGRSVISEYKSKFGGNFDYDETIKTKPDLEVPDNFKLLIDDNSRYANKAKKYCLDRGLEDRDFWFFRLGVSHSDDYYWVNRVIMPFYDDLGNFNCFCGRDITGKNKFKYYNSIVDKNNLIFNEFHVSWDEELTIVEGMFDLVKCNDNAVPLLGSDLNVDSKLYKTIISNRTPILMGLDPDMKNKKTIKIADRLTRDGIKVRVMDLKDGYDIGSLTKKEVKKLSKQARVWNYDKRIKDKLKNIKVVSIL